MDKHVNAVIYARFSSHNQQEQSIEGQLRYCHDYAAQHGYNVVTEYIDRAISGTTDNRPEFQRMIKDAAGRGFLYGSWTVSAATAMIARSINANCKSMVCASCP